MSPRPPVTLIDLVRSRAERQPTGTAFCFLRDGDGDGATLTFGDLDRRARAIGARLQGEGLAGRPVLVMQMPGLEYIASLFGTVYAGAVPVPVYPPMPGRGLNRLESIIAIADAPAALTSRGLMAMTGVESISRLRWIATDDVDDCGDAWRAPSIAADSLALLQFTSGSTSAPRGVMLSHRNILDHADAMHLAGDPSAVNIGLMWVPPYHDMGLIGGIVAPLFAGRGMFLMSPLAFLEQPLRWLRAISRYRVTTSGGPMFAYDLCVRRSTPADREGLDLRCWRFAGLGAEPIRADALDRFARAFGPYGFSRRAFCPAFGLAEATLVVTGTRPLEMPTVLDARVTALAENRYEAAADGEPARPLVSCGRPTGPQRVVIVDPISQVARPTGEVGEIWVSGPNVAGGYWRAPKESEATFGAHLAMGDGPFLRTGDLGFEYGGELYVTGRLKDLIIVHGQNHYPQDIEQTVQDCDPILRPGCGAVFGRDVDDVERVIVVQEVRRMPDEPERLLRAIREAVMAQHGLEVFSVLLIGSGALPKTSSGKIQRYAARDAYDRDGFEVLTRWDAPRKAADGQRDAGSQGRRDIWQTALATMAAAPREAVIRQVLRDESAAILEIAADAVDVEASLLTLGMDSVRGMHLVVFIEETFGVTPGFEEVISGTTIASLATDIGCRMAADGPSVTRRAP